MTSNDFFPPGSIAAVALPLGNAADITKRAIDILCAADIVAAEDTRDAGKLLKELGASARLVSYHDWNEAQRAERILSYAKEGLKIAVVSDAGTPGVSDPGFDVVRLARMNGVKIFPVPGPCALTAFISVSGLPSNAFTFLGFPPSKSGKRQSFFEQYAERRETLVFYESPRRIVTALKDAIDIFGDREGSLAREMTKPYEEFLFGSLSEILSDLEGRPKILGEICWGVRGLSSAQARERFFEEAARRDKKPFSEEIDKKGMKAAAKKLAKEKGIGTKEAYAFLLAGKERSRP